MPRFKFSPATEPAPTPGVQFSGRILALLFVAPTVYFLLTFWPALFGGQTYGNRLVHERVAAELDAYAAPKAAPLQEQAPETLHPDYHLLYEPANKEIQTAFRSFRLPLYNPHRILGTALWGSPVADPANPLSLLLLFASPDVVHLAKLYVYMVIGFIGLWLCAVQIFDAAVIPAFIGASIYILNPYMYYFFHWTSAYGVAAVAPVLFLLVHHIIEGRRPGMALLFQLALAWALLINQLEELCYTALFIGAWIAVASALRIYRPGQLWSAAPRLAGAAAGAAALSAGYTWYEFQLGQGLVRTPHTYATFRQVIGHALYRRPMIGMWLDGSPLNASRGHDGQMMFIPIAALVIVLLAVGFCRPALGRARAALLILTGAIVIHAFVIPLDFPLYAVHFPLYTLNIEHRRLAFVFFLCASLSVAGCLTALTTAGAKAPVSWRRIAWCAAAAGVGYAVLSARTLQHHGTEAFIPLTSAMAFAGLWLGFRRGFSRRAIGIVAIGLTAPYVFLAMTRVPFYDASQDRFRNVVSEVRSDGSSSRSVRLVADYASINSAKHEFLWYCDATFALFGRDGLMGYDTALQKSVAKTVSVLYSPAIRNEIETDAMFKNGTQSSVLWPDPDGVLQPDGKLSPVNEARLRLLGAGSVIARNKIPNLAEAEWSDALRGWEHRLKNSSAFLFLEHGDVDEVAALFQAGAPDSLGLDILHRTTAVSYRLDEKSGTYRADVPGGSGTLVIAYDIGRFYRAYVNDRPVDFEAAKGLPFLFLRNTSSAAVIELRPDTRGIWRLWGLGFGAGLVLMAGVWMLEKRSLSLQAE